MPGRHGVKAESFGPLQQAVELDVSVALYAGVRRATCLVVGHIGGDDFLVKLFAEVEHMMFNAEMVADTAGIIHI